MSKFAPAACMAAINDGLSDYYNMFYCYSNIEIMTMAYINTVLVIYLTTLYIKTGLRNYTLSKLMCKVKTSILLMLIVYQLILIARYTISFNGTDLYLFVLTFQQYLQSVMYQ